MRSRLFISVASITLWAAMAIPAWAQTAQAPQPAKAGEAAQPAKAAEPAPQFPFEGEISGTNVYVRSGPGVNYYPSTKLNAGDRVVVQGEQYSWYEIVPPPKCFSYIDMAMVEKQAGGKTGKVIQDKVYVRAGSDLETRKTKTQIVVSKGTTVDILGEVDGFYKIKPPPGATLFVSKQFIEVVPARLKTGLVEKHTSGAKSAEPPKAATPPAGTPAKAAAGTPANPPAATPANPPAGTPVKSAAGPTPVPEATKATPPAGEQPNSTEAGTAPDGDMEADIASEDDGEPLEANSTLPGQQAPARPAPAAKAPGKTKPAGPKSEKPGEMTPGGTGRWSALLTVLESELRAVSQGAIEEQALTGLQARYTEIATQTDDKVAAQVAQIRVQQLGELIALRAGREAILADTHDLDDFRLKMNEERKKIMLRRLEKVWEEYDLQGELRQSYAFAAEKHRYRLVDPATQTTKAYVDIPPTVNVKPDELIGQIVGIRTVSQRFNAATQVPIALAKEVVDLSPRNAVPAPTKTDEPSNAGNKPAANPKSIDKGTPDAGIPPKKPLSTGPTPEPAKQPATGAGEPPRKSE